MQSSYLRLKNNKTARNIILKHLVEDRSCGLFFYGIYTSQKIRWSKLFQIHPNEYYTTFIYLYHTDYFKILANIVIAFAIIIYSLFKPYSASLPYIFLSTIRVPNISKNATGSAIAIVLTNPAIMYETNDTAATVNA